MIKYKSIIFFFNNYQLRHYIYSYNHLLHNFNNLIIILVFYFQTTVIAFK